MSDFTSWAALSGVGLTMLGLFLAFVRFVGAGIEAVRTELGERVRIARAEGDARIEKIAESEMLSRNTMIANLSASCLKLENELDRVRRDTVRREELASLEARMNTILMKIEGKLDALVEKIVDFKGLEIQIRNAGDRLDTMTKRFEREKL